MILVDTSVWIDHLRVAELKLAEELRARRVLVHPYVIGELVLGSLRQPALVAENLGRLRAAPIASTTEILDLIVKRGLGGTGVGYVDAHLIASVMLTPGCRLWTRDKKLLAAAKKLELPLAPVA